MTAYSGIVYHNYEDKYDRHNRYKYYTKLTQYLKKAEYIGRKFKRTQPVNLCNGTHSSVKERYIFNPGSTQKRTQKRTHINVHNEKIDVSFMEVDSTSDLVVLFATPELVLIERTDHFLGKKRYEMLCPRYINDGNYDFFGKQIPQTKSKEDVLLEIMEQIESDKQKFEEEKVKEKRKFR